MKKKSASVAAATILLSVLSLIFLLLWTPSHLEQIINFASENRLLAPLLVISWRILAIVIPPIPGGMLSFALMPVFGWFWSYLYALAGVLTGASIAFFLSRHFREPLVRRVVPLQQLQAWENKISTRTEFFAFLIIRITTGPVLDFISYAAGLSKISYGKFIAATFISLLPDLALYYFGGKLYETLSRGNTYVGLASLIVIIGVLYIAGKSRLFKKTD